MGLNIGAQLDRFKDMQHSHCEKVVQTLKKKWCADYHPAATLAT